MRINSNDLATYSREMRRFFEIQKIETTSDLQRFVEGRIVFPIGSTGYWIEFDLRDSNVRTKAYAVSYTSKGPFTPLQIRVNKDLRYSQIFVRSQQPVKGYHAFDRDLQGNLALAKVLHSTDINMIKRSLEELELPLTSKL